MRVRVRWKQPAGGWDGRMIAGSAAALLRPAALMCWALALWRLGDRLNLTGAFAITEGPFSTWQVWGAVATGLQLCAWVLNRYGSRDHPD